MFRKKSLFVFLPLILIPVIYLLGPRPNLGNVDDKTEKPTVQIAELDSFIAHSESKVSDIKTNNESTIFWADSLHKSKTEYCLLYIHGFSASIGEGDPVHRDFASRYGMNLYVPRLYEHGRKDVDAFKNFSADQYFESAQQAYEIAKTMGEKVIVMSCSSGSTLSIMLARTNPEIHSFIMYSPNIDIKDPTSALVTGPWGRQLLSVVMKGDYNYIKYIPEARKYWYEKYHVDGIIALKGMLEKYMTPDNFKLIHQPLYMGYYYVDDEHQDQVVSVPHMLDFYDRISTPKDKKKKKSFTTAKGHVICSAIMNPNVKDVELETYRFAEEVLKLIPVSDKSSINQGSNK